MFQRYFRTVSGALVIVCAAAPGSATVVTSMTLSTNNIGVARKQAGLPRRKSTNAKPQAALSCGNISKAAPNSFVGVVKGGNTAGGDPQEDPTKVTDYAGVVAGCANAAGSSFTGVLAGQKNSVGGADFFDFTTFDSVIGGGLENDIDIANDSIVGAGQNNSVSGGTFNGGDDASDSGILAGVKNSVGAQGSFIGAGTNNVIGTDNFVEGPGYGIASSFIGSGDGNAINGATQSAIVAGSSNTLGQVVYSGKLPANVKAATIGGGYKNTMLANYGYIGGGYGNAVTGTVASIGGGYSNAASGQNATIPGGAYNVASGLDSFAAGNGSHATAAGAFVWSDDSAGATTLSSSAANQFIARAAGGFYLYSSATLKSGVKLAPGSGSWSSLSDRAAKTAVEDVNDARILAKVAALPVSEWSYTAQGAGVRHLGPMAQDFRAAFGLGEDAKHISAIDEEGVALAAIKALAAEVAVKDRKLADLEQRLAAVEKVVARAR